MKKLAISTLMSILFCTSAYANELHIDLNEDTFQGQFDATNASSGLLFSARVTATDESQVYSIGARTNQPVSAQSNLGGGFGGKLYLIDGDFDIFSALALGGNLEFKIRDIEDFSILSSVYYAPSFLTFDDRVDTFIDVSLRLQYQIFKNSAIYVGARNLRAENSNGDSEAIDRGFHIGFSLDI